MGFLHVPLGSEIPLADLFSEMPDAPKAFIRRGFSVVARLPESAYAPLMAAAIASAGERSKTSQEQLAKTLSIPVTDATGAVAALGMFSALASVRSETVEQVLQQMVDSEVISNSDKPSLLRIVPELTKAAPALKRAVKKNMLANAVLPSFDDFEAVLDIRLGDERQGGFALPVAIAFLDTDARDQELWFQLTKTDTEGLIEKLNSLLKRFKEAEELIGKWPSNAGGA